MTNKKLSVQLSIEEVQALLELVANQLFRVRFIDRRMPGHKTNPEMMEMADSAVKTLQEVLKKAKGLILTEPGHLKEHQLILKRSVVQV